MFVLRFLWKCLWMTVAYLIVGPIGALVSFGMMFLGKKR